MTTIHAETIGGKVILPKTDLDKLLELARRAEAIELLSEQTELSTAGIMHLEDSGGSFEFLSCEDDLYSVDDLKIRYR